MDNEVSVPCDEALAEPAFEIVPRHETVRSLEKDTRGEDVA